MKLFPNGINITKKRVAISVIITFMLFSSLFLGATLTVPTAFNQGYKSGYESGYLQSLQDVNKALKERGIQAVFEWKDLGNGAYKVSLMSEGKLYAVGYVEPHLWLEHWRLFGNLDIGQRLYALSQVGNSVLWSNWMDKNNDGIEQPEEHNDWNSNDIIDFPEDYWFRLSKEYGAGVITTLGLNWIETQLSGTLNASQQALYLSDSNDATDPPLASWTVLPSEITTNGLDRQTGTYASTGNGAWNVTKTKTATGTQSTQLWGINYDSTDGSNYLLAGDSGPSQKNMVSGDTLKETWQITVT